MESNQNITDNLKEIVHRNENFSSADNLNYLYPNGYRITHSMRLLKGILDIGLRSDIAA